MNTTHDPNWENSTLKEQPYIAGKHCVRCGHEKGTEGRCNVYDTEYKKHLYDKKTMKHSQDEKKLTEVMTYEEYTKKLHSYFRKLVHYQYDVNNGADNGEEFDKAREHTDNEMYNYFQQAITKAQKTAREETLKELLTEYNESELDGKGYDFYFSIRTKYNKIKKL